MVLDQFVRLLPALESSLEQLLRHPVDTYAGENEYDYDPYAYAVGCMDHLFANYFDVGRQNGLL